MDNMDPIDSKFLATEAPAGEACGKADDLEKNELYQNHTKIAPPKSLKAKDLIEKGLMEPSDVEGFKQLLFHATCAGLCILAVSWCIENRSWPLLILAYLVFAITSSFIFNGFHEMVHNTAFRTRAFNTCFAHIIGFFIFRGATWFWCFHWQHHRYTNDVTLDPELSGGSLDLQDPTLTSKGYFSFLSGYPFGFERALGMAKMAIGAREDPWVANKLPHTQRKVRVESAVYVMGYVLLAASALFVWPDWSLARAIVLFWLLPHCLGAGHLRMYQFAEHRACTMGPYTETNAWIAARTTATWKPYCKLAWYMPFHIEHHSWPNVPFHKLETVHALVRKAYEEEGAPAIPSGCDPRGADGYINLHSVQFKRMLSNVFGSKSSVVDGTNGGVSKEPLLADQRL